MENSKLFAGKYAKIIEGIQVTEDDFQHHDTLEKYLEYLILTYGMHEDSLCSYLLTKPLVLREHKNQSFRFAVTGNFELEKNNSFNENCLGLYALATVTTEKVAMYRALRICSDVRTNYLRHYPGRCLRNTGESNFDTWAPDTAIVYMAFFDKDLYPPKDGI